MFLSIDEAVTSILQKSPVAIPTDAVYGPAAAYQDVKWIDFIDVNQEILSLLQRHLAKASLKPMD